MFDIHAGYIILIAGAVTSLLRFLPFIAFSKRTPDFILYLGRVLPYAVMMMLAVYCLRGVNFFDNSHGLPEILACLLVILLHVWQRNTLLSIIAGTWLYMFLVQVVF
ncbi:MAG: AzlD domain-containing protein [Synergistaceae bacterium]|nr:AzlD domain-containing protein [Synergistaceae bacterium]